MRGLSFVKFFNLLFVFLFLLISCKQHVSGDRTKFKTISESDISSFPLKGELKERKTEFSGLTWSNNLLVLLPQYPQLYKDHFDGALFTVTREELMSCINTDFTEPLNYSKIEIDFNGLDGRLLNHGSGFESVAFDSNIVFFTIESGGHFNTVGNIIKGEFDKEKNIIRLLPETLKRIDPQADISNLSEETMLLFNKKIFTMYEANGHNVNTNPVVHIFDYSLNSAGLIPLENLEYRITDATSPDTSGNFWVINYMWPEDEGDLLPSDDKEFRKFGIGKSQLNTKTVERLIEFKIEKNKIIRTEEAPIYLKLDFEKGSRNWEGIVRFGAGFILVTDKYPETILGYYSR